MLELDVKDVEKVKMTLSLAAEPRIEVTLTRLTALILVRNRNNHKENAFKRDAPE